MTASPETEVAQRPRLRELSEHGDPLEKLAATVDFEIFRADLVALKACDPAKGGRLGFDPVLKFRMLVLQAWSRRRSFRMNRAAFEQAAAKLAQYRVVEASINEIDRYFQSMRARTASAAGRSGRFSRNCRMVTSATAAAPAGPVSGRDH